MTTSYAEVKPDNLEGAVRDQGRSQGGGESEEFPRLLIFCPGIPETNYAKAIGKSGKCPAFYLFGPGLGIPGTATVRDTIFWALLFQPLDNC